jgi:NADH dehydrogenase/NADH:ubiquinone oxidoreductase subunit G
MGFYNKVKWILGILLVFGVVISTNLIDRNNFIQVRESVVTIYEDRLVANDLIFEMSLLLQEKLAATAVSNNDFFSNKNQQVNEKITGFLARYDQTKLTTEEAKLFANLKVNLEKLKTTEVAFAKSNFSNKIPIVNQIAVVKENLYQLSKIQLHEGGVQMSISKKAVDSIELFTQLEIYLLIALAILIQIIVIYNPKEKSSKKSDL